MLHFALKATFLYNRIVLGNKPNIAFEKGSQTKNHERFIVFFSFYGLKIRE